MQLTTARLQLRSFRDDDVEAFCALHADPEVMLFLGGTLSRAEAENELRDILAMESSSGLIRFALERTISPGLIGYCGLKPAGDFVDLSYMIARPHWGRGYALEAALCVSEYARSQLGLTTLEAGGAAENVASIKILERLGFRYREELIFDGRPSVRFFD